MKLSPKTINLSLCWCMKLKRNVPESMIRRNGKKYTVYLYIFFLLHSFVCAYVSCLLNVLVALCPCKAHEYMKNPGLHSDSAPSCVTQYSALHASSVPPHTPVLVSLLTSPGLLSHTVPFFPHFPSRHTTLVEGVNAGGDLEEEEGILYKNVSFVHSVR